MSELIMDQVDDFDFFANSTIENPGKGDFLDDIKERSFIFHL